eukprot:scaffold307890_cov32-Prasinocladus_malaysianus.AAC.1
MPEAKTRAIDAAQGSAPETPELPFEQSRAYHSPQAKDIAEDQMEGPRNFQRHHGQRAKIRQPGCFSCFMSRD